MQVFAFWKLFFTVSDNPIIKPCLSSRHRQGVICHELIVWPFHETWNMELLRTFCEVINSDSQQLYPFCLKGAGNKTCYQFVQMSFSFSCSHHWVTDLLHQTELSADQGMFYLFRSQYKTEGLFCHAYWYNFSFDLLWIQKLCLKILSVHWMWLLSFAEA